MNAFQAVQEIVKENLYSPQPLPPFLVHAVELFNKVHLYYRTYHYTALLSKKPKNSITGHPAVYGAALHLLGDYTSVGSYAITIALVTKCTQDILREYQKLSEYYQNLKQTVRWQYPLYHPIIRKKETKNTPLLLTPSFFMYYHVQSLRFSKQILKICRCALEMFWQFFKLSMCLCDASLLLKSDPHARYQACTELVAEWENYQRQLKENQQWLLEEIEKRQALAEDILTRLGSKNKVGFIIDQFKQTIRDLMKEAEGTEDTLYTNAEETLDTIFASGKIVPLHIDLTTKLVPPLFTYQRFPPWAGQKVVTITSQPTPSSPSLGNSILGQLSVLPISKAVEGYQWLAKHLNPFYQQQVKVDGD